MRYIMSEEERKKILHGVCSKTAACLPTSATSV